MSGTGLLTRHIINELKQNSDLLVEYTLTDISYAVRALSYHMSILIIHLFFSPARRQFSSQPIIWIGYSKGVRY
jgi:hypothetical protein